MPERLNKCPLCKSGLFLNHQEVVDYAVSKETFILCKCSNCHIQFTNPRPSMEEISPYYNFAEYYSHEDKAKTLTQWIYQQVRSYSISKKIAFIKSLKKKGRLLDYGCGTGEFLAAAKKKGWKTAGIEPSEKARTQANQKLENRVVATIDDLDNESSFDIITLYHVLEHIHELRKTTKKILNHLKSNGYLIIAVPNHESWDAYYYGKFWAAWDVPRHLYHFNSDSMNKFKEEFDLELKGIKPMKFDSFYVSLLSEGYKDKGITLIGKYWKGFFKGLKSNQSAKTPGNHSSNIYIFQKK
jgi:2-polyprenyl-3-methyl-5-hydroxy-6-metoxy-1,4-benzoquinol methylase